ncbi:hypothetical protein PR202_gb29391 [Eleusine coracana subsp. coracana]|uniref:Uncharacterized protein n=1 Tax=Eleusine coracana subsp. coracana TaxID=191504 RepID=A0AAV5G0D8_ELECO|nr:hypothetical protein PR202_gb29391 [Eleusine coracana subsp. coracana]
MLQPPRHLPCLASAASSRAQLPRPSGRRRQQDVLGVTAGCSSHRHLPCPASASPCPDGSHCRALAPADLAPAR